VGLKVYNRESGVCLKLTVRCAVHNWVMWDHTR